jgi:hypothetical protein
VKGVWTSCLELTSTPKDAGLECEDYRHIAQEEEATDSENDLAFVAVPLL